MLKGWRASWIGIASSAFFLAAIFWILHHQQGLDDLASIWRRSDKGAIWLAIAAMTAANVAAASRLMLIMSAIGVAHVQLLPTLRIQMVSLFAAHGAPISALGDVARAAMLKLRFNVTMGRAVRIVCYERVFGALGATIIGLGAALVQLCLPPPHPLLKIQFLLWGSGLIGTGLVTLWSRLHVNIRFEPVNQTVRAVAMLGEILGNPTMCVKLTAVSLLQMVSMAFVFIIMATGMHIASSPVQSMLFMPLIFFVSSLPIFYLGWGAREAVVIATLGSAATVSAAEAVALSVAFGVIVFLSSVPGALLWLLRPSMRKAIGDAELNIPRAEKA